MSTLKVLSIFKNCKIYVEKEKSINLDSLYNKIVYNKQPRFVQTKCSEIYRFINNGHFTFTDVKIYILYKYIFQNKMNWKDIKVSNILACKKLFSTKQLERDKKFILEVNKKVKFKDINIFYKVNANGKNILLDFILDKYISPMFYVHMLKYRKDENQKFKSSDILKKVDRIVGKLSTLLKESKRN